MEVAYGDSLITNVSLEGREAGGVRASGQERVSMGLSLLGETSPWFWALRTGWLDFSFI